MYTGLKLLPRRLNSTVVNPISWQAVLRSVLLRLESVRDRRKQLTTRALAVASTDLTTTSTSSSSTSNTSTKPNILSLPPPALKGKGAYKLNRDYILNLTSDATDRLVNIHLATKALETDELYTLPVEHKIAVLATLIEACNGNKEISQLMVCQ